MPETPAANASPDVLDDLPTAQALIEQQALTILELQQAVGKLEQEKQELQLAFDELVRRAFLKRSERYIHDPDQLRLDFGETDQAASAAEGLADALEASALEESQQTIPEHTRRRPGRQRRSEQLPEHLPRYEVEVEAPEDLRCCPTHGERTLIGYDRVDTLEFARPKLRVRVTKYQKYVCAAAPACGVASPERPTGLVEGGRYDTGIAAEVITGKYGYHLPVYREQDYFAGSGWTPSRSTLLNLLAASAFVIRPLIAHFRRQVLGSGRVGTDDTSVTLLVPKVIPRPDPSAPKSQRIGEVLGEAIEQGKPSVPGRMWAYRGITVPLNVFDFTVSHHRDGPDLFLEGFAGTLLADCYSGYQGITLRSGGAIVRAACNAHARRKLFDARGNYPLEASVLLAKYQQLYDIEDRARRMSPEERLRLPPAAA